MFGLSREIRYFISIWPRTNECRRLGLPSAFDVSFCPQGPNVERSSCHCFTYAGLFSFLTPISIVLCHRNCSCCWPVAICVAAHITLALFCCIPRLLPLLCQVAEQYTLLDATVEDFAPLSPRTKTILPEHGASAKKMVRVCVLCVRDFLCCGASPLSVPAFPFSSVELFCIRASTGPRLHRSVATATPR